MSEIERHELTEINAKIDRLFLIVEGNSHQGIEGLVPMLQRHMKESSDNFKQFKDTNNTRLNKLEEESVNHARKNGFIAGIGSVVGAVIGYLISIFK